MREKLNSKRITLGIIGLGDMGKLYARQFAKAGFSVKGCDLPARKAALENELRDTGIEILEDGRQVAASSDLIVYSVEAANLESVVAVSAPAARPGSIVAGQTAVKTTEIETLERHLPQGCHIITCHSMHGPSVSTEGQTLLLIRHRSTDEAYRRGKNVFSRLGSTIIELPGGAEHDRLTADIQTVTHLCFESMGTAWKNAGIFPWENPAYAGGIDNVKVLMALRIFSGKAHVYGELAILNPFAREQVSQYSKSVGELLELAATGKESALRKRIHDAGEAVFHTSSRRPLLDQAPLGEFGLGLSPDQRKPNSHLSLLAMADAWHQLGVSPYENLVCRTPPYLLRTGIAEHLFRDPTLLEESLQTALHDKEVRNHDLQFKAAVENWASIIKARDLNAYSRLFESTRAFFHDRLQDGMRKSDELIRRLGRLA